MIIRLNKPRHRQKIAAFDYDHTLVKPKDGRRFPKDENDWIWLYENVPNKLKQYYEDGYGIYVFTNQTKDWKKKHILNSLETLEIPMTIVIAYDKTEHKPSTVMFETVIENKKWDKKKSFFVGDALGRQGDFADTDRLFANAIGLAIKSPEEEFLENEKENTSYEAIQQMAKKIKKRKDQELVLMVGYPGSGKSTIANELRKYGYDIIDGDVHKTDNKRKSLIAEALEKKQSVVFDATNLTKEKRGIYIEIAKELSLPVRCIYISTSMEKSMELNLKRSAEKQVPKVAYYKMRKTFEEPTENEGCEILKL